ncbi:MAG: acyltransferase [Parasporobacterium sp.]|nr:acyltransferase [Parasporobacterium sp.]
MEKHRIIDILKAFSIILVVFYHAVMCSPIPWESFPWMEAMVTLKCIHVPLFILIAGYLCHKQPVGQFFLKKVSRILVPFAFMTCLKLIFSLFVSDEYSHGDSLGTKFYEAFIKGDLFWFCYCILIIFLLAPLIWNSRLRMWLALGIFTAADVVIAVTGVQITGIFQIAQVIYHMPFFAVGMLLAEYGFFARIRTPGKLIAGSAAALAVGAVCIYLRFVLYIYWLYLPEALIGLSGMFILYVISVLAEKSGRVKPGGMVDFCQRFPDAQPLIIGSRNTSVEAFLMGEVPLF